MRNVPRNAYRHIRTQVVPLAACRDRQARHAMRVTQLMQLWCLPARDAPCTRCHLSCCTMEHTVAAPPSPDSALADVSVTAPHVMCAVMQPPPMPPAADTSAVAALADTAEAVTAASLPWSWVQVAAPCCACCARNTGRYRGGAMADGGAGPWRAVPVGG